MNLSELIEKNRKIEETINDLTINLLKIEEKFINLRGPFIIKDKDSLILTDGFSYNSLIESKSFKIDVLTKISEELMNDKYKIESHTCIYFNSSKYLTDNIDLSYKSDTGDFELICNLACNIKKFKISRMIFFKLITEMIQCCKSV